MNDSDLQDHTRRSLNEPPLDPATRNRLDTARQQALDSRPSRVWTTYAMPALVTASLAAITIVITLTQLSDPPAVDVDAIETFEIITSRDELEMYENLEFYLWLDDSLSG